MSHLEIRGFKNLNENAEEYRTIQKSSSSFSCLEFYRSIGGSETLRKVAALLSKRMASSARAVHSPEKNARSTLPPRSSAEDFRFSA